MNELANAPTPVSTYPDEPRTNYLLWIVLALVLLIAIGGLMAFSLYKFTQRNLATFLAKGARFEQGMPAAKNDLYGTLAGLKIVEVVPNSPAERVGLKYGDVLLAYNKRPITNEDEIDAVMAYFQRQYDRTGKPAMAELSLYRDGDMTVKTLSVPTGRLGIYTREWTFAGAFVEDAIVDRDNYAAAEQYANQAAASGKYSEDQILHMRMLCLNNEEDGESLRRAQVDELYSKYPPDRLTLFGNYDLLYNKRYRAAAAVFERYLQIKKVDVSTELNLASCYTEMEKFDEAEELITKVLDRPEHDPNAPSEYGLSVLSNIRAKIFMGRREYDRARAGFEAALDRYPNDSYYTLAYLYCAMRQELSGQKPGEFEAAYKSVSNRSRETERFMGYHIDALRAFLWAKQSRTAQAQAAVARWRESPDAKRYIPIFWRRFPDGTQVIDNWNALMNQ